MVYIKSTRNKFPDFLLTFSVLRITVCNMNVNYSLKTNAAEQITTARLPADTRNRLVALARVKNKTKSEIIIDALEMYYKQEENELDSYTLGLPYFGRYGSKTGDLSITYKQKIKEKLRARQNSY